MGSLFFDEKEKKYFTDLPEKKFSDASGEKTSKEGGRELCELGGEDPYPTLFEARLPRKKNSPRNPMVTGAIYYI